VAVYERTYRSYSGPQTPERTRFLVLPRYALSEALGSKLFVLFLGICWVWCLVLSVLIYLPHNLGFLEKFQVDPAMISRFYGDYGAGFFFNWFMRPYGLAASFIVAFVIGPAMISADLRNNALPLYLSRPFSRIEYLTGKATVLVVLISVVTWVPGLLLFLLQASLGGWSWLSANWRIGPAIFVSFAIWTAVLSLLSLSLSAYVRWKPAARAALLFVFLVAAALGALINFNLGTSWGSLINIGDMVYVVWARLFGVDAEVGVPLWAAWGALLALCAFCIVLLDRKVRAYEVVR